MSASHKSDPAGTSVTHGCGDLPAVRVRAFNCELRDKDGFLGDRGSKRAFQSILERSREALRAQGRDPLGDRPTRSFGKKALDRMLLKGHPEAAGLVMGATEAFACELSAVVQRLLRTRGWRDVQRVAIGGGLRASRVGELAIGRASLLVRAAGHDVSMRPISHHPDEAGLVGAAHLVPAGMLEGHDCMLAIDIGGTNIRAGLVELHGRKAVDLRRARVMGLDLWRHRDDSPTRDEAVGHICDMLGDLVRRVGRDRLRLAPVIGVGVPGVIDEGGTIERGAQNLPGRWEGEGFSLAERIEAALPRIDGRKTNVVLHNDAVVQGLSETPWMQDVRRWGVLTIGTGLGNASFENRCG